jgi:hypothetical protein
VRRDYDTSLPELVGDREQLIQAVLNIARNAAQAMGGEGDARSCCARASLRQVTLAKRYRLALEIKVIDNGPGHPGTGSRAHVLSAGFGPRGRQRAGADDCPGLRAAPSRHHRLLQRTRPHAVHLRLPVEQA